MAAVQENLPNGLYPGLVVESFVKPGPTRFQLNFRTGDAGDYAFHFNGRFDDGPALVVVRNSCIGGVWGAEERTEPNFPFAVGQWSRILVVVTESQYSVYVNDNHFIDYKHRLKDLSAIKVVNVAGDVQKAALRVIGA